MTTLMSVGYLLKTEDAVIKQTLDEYGELQDDLVNIIDLLFKLSHFLNEDVEIESVDNNFQVLANSYYLQFPYTLKSIHDLWIKGSYLETLIILRHIIEGFAKLRYFTNHRDEILNHTNGKNRVRFKTMFDEIAPGYYRFHYGKILSDYAHGGFKAYMLRVEYSSQTEGRVKVGCEFDTKYSGMIIYQVLTFCFGYLNYVDEFFPTIYSRLDEEIMDEKYSILENLKVKMNVKKDTEKQQKEWDDVILPFISKK